ncbi:hypothetical protein DET57_11481 [Klebsiella oxytoca]|uniref:Uncharacterized protein n=1 Tax=Klebsiella oxytoca TaxID=571 RepID=A0A318FJ84_KLEOX|nr:hypothetical protein [Klebsiella oxytoca]PXW42089.1 hypothetical protein DET57_11481 [Klebsiella oxytoca]
MSDEVKLMTDDALKALIESRESEPEPPEKNTASIPPSAFNGEFIPD